MGSQEAHRVDMAKCGERKHENMWFAHDFGLSLRLPFFLYVVLVVLDMIA